MSERKKSKKRKKKKGSKTEERLKRIIELLLKLLEGKLEKRGKYEKLRGMPSRSRGYPRGRPINPNVYDRYRRYRPVQEKRYKPKPRKVSLSFGKTWSEPKTYTPKKGAMYDPELKKLLKDVKKYLSEFSELNPEKAGTLEKNYRPDFLEDFLEKELVKMNESESKPKLYKLDRDEVEGKEGEVKPEKHGEINAKELSEYLEKLGEKEGMGIAGPFEMGDTDFNRLVEELKVRGKATEEAPEMKVEQESAEKAEAEPGEQIEDMYMEDEAEVLRELENDQKNEGAGPEIEADIEASKLLETPAVGLNVEPNSALEKPGLKPDLSPQAEIDRVYEAELFADVDELFQDLEGKLRPELEPEENLEASGPY